MCALCRIDADQKTYCPGCFDRLSAEGTLASAVTRVRNYAGWAGICLIVCLGTYFLPSPIAGPLGVIFCIKGLKEKRDRKESDGIVRLYLMMILSILTVVVGGLLFAAILGAFTSRPES